MTPRTWIGSVGAAALGAALVGGALLAPPLRVGTIRVTGADQVTRVQAETLARAYVVRHASFANHPRLFLVRTSELAAELERALPHIATVRVTRTIPDTLEVTLQETVPVAFLEIQNRTFALDANGRAIAEVSADDARAAQLPLIRDAHTTGSVAVGDLVLRPAVLDVLHEVVVRLPERLGVSAEELLIPAIGAEEVTVRTDRGWALLLDVRRPLQDQLGALDKVLAEELAPEDVSRLEYVDLRIQGKVFYRLRPRSSR